MPVTIRERSDYAVVAIEGRLDVITAPEVAAVVASLPLESLDGVVIDLARVSSIDSRGIGMLAWQHNELAGDGKRLAIANPTEQARMVLKVTHCDRLLEVADSVDQAVALHTGARTARGGRP